MKDFTVPRTTRRLVRDEPNLRMFSRLWQINWFFVLLICCLAGVGYTALYSAGGGRAAPFAQPQAIRFGFGLLMMLGVALASPRLLRLVSVPIYMFSVTLLAMG